MTARRDRSELEPLWHATAPPVPADASIGPDRAERLPSGTADTVVIGAGVTGLSTALHLAERGARVVVLERDGPGCGTTGRSNGQVIAGLQEPPDALLAAYGYERGERLVEFAGKAPELVFELIARHRIDCEAERHGWIQATRSSHHLKALKRLAESWSRRGAPVRVLDKEETAALLGTRVYVGGWEDRRNGTIQPFAYARGLAEAAIRTGAAIHHGVEARELVRSGAAWRIATDAGDMTASTVVVALGVSTFGLEGAIHTSVGRSYASAYSVQLATEPLGADVLRSVLPRRHACGDSHHLRLRYFRLDAGNRFVIGGPGWLTPPRSGSAISFRILEASTRRMFPQLRGARFAFRWFAHDAVTPDLLPHLYEPEPGLFAALGYNGRGLAIGTAIGSVLARRVLGEHPDSLPFPTTEPSSMPLNLPSAAAFWLRRAFGRH